MKKRFCGGLLLLMLLLLPVGCSKTMQGTDALLAKARREIPIAEAETAVLQYAGTCGRDGEALVWFISGGEYQAHTYYAMECRDLGEDRYTFLRSPKPMNRAEDIAVLQWKDGYCFLINNAHCRSVLLTDEAGRETTISVAADALPYLFYEETIPHAYVFLDEAGREIPQR